MRHLFQRERTDPGPIFEMMEELAADGTSSTLEVFPSACGLRWKASIADTCADYGATPQEAWRNACDAWERRKRPEPERVFPAEAGCTKHYTTDLGQPYTVTYTDHPEQPSDPD